MPEAKYVKCPSNLPSVLRDYLSQHGITQERFANRAGVGKRTISRVVSGSGQKYMDKNVLRKILSQMGPGWSSGILDTEQERGDGILCFFDKLNSENRRILRTWASGLLEKQRALDRAGSEYAVYIETTNRELLS